MISRISDPIPAPQYRPANTDSSLVPGRTQRAGQAPRVLAIANQKGGVGKTTTAINLGTALAAIGERVLIVDLDPQGNASTGLGIDRRNRRCSTYDVLIGEAPMRDAIVPTAVPRLSIAPSTLDLSGLELEIGQARDRAFRLRSALAPLNTGKFAGVGDFTYVLVDCPPSLNLLTVNAMAAANAILVPLQCEFFALEGLSQLLKTVEQVKTTLNPGADHPRHRAHHVRRAQQSLQPGRRRRARVHGPQGLRHHHPAQRARLRKRRPTASRCWSTISNASAAKPICGSRPKSSSARRSCAPQLKPRLG